MKPAIVFRSLLKGVAAGLLVYEVYETRRIPSRSALVLAPGEDCVIEDDERLGEAAVRLVYADAIAVHPDDTRRDGKAFVVTCRIEDEGEFDED